MSFYGPSIIGFNNEPTVDVPFVETMGFIRAFGPNLGNKLTVENNVGDEIFNVDTATPLISVGADVVPTVASTINLGSASLPFATVYADSITFPTFTPNAIAQTDGSSDLFASNTIAKTGSGTTVNAFTVQNTSTTVASQIAIQFETRAVSDQIVFGQSSAITHFTIPNSGLIIEGQNNPNKLFIQDNSTTRIFAVSTSTGVVATKNNILDDGSGIMTINIDDDGIAGLALTLFNTSGVASSGVKIGLQGLDNLGLLETNTISWTPNTTGSYVSFDNTGVEVLSNYISTSNVANGLGSVATGISNVVGLAMTGSDTLTGLYFVMSTSTLYVTGDVLSSLIIGQQIFFAIMPGDMWDGQVGSVTYDGGSNSTAIVLAGTLPSTDISTPPLWISAGACSLAIGQSNVAYSTDSILVGAGCNAFGDYMDLFGLNLTANGQNCFLAGIGISMIANNSFAWNDGSMSLNLTGNNTFTVSAFGGFNLLGNQVITFGTLASNVVSINQVSMADGITDNFNLMTLLTQSTDPTYTKNAYYLGSGSGTSDLYIIPDYYASTPTLSTVMFDVNTGLGTANFACYLESDKTIFATQGLLLGGGTGPLTGFVGSPPSMAGTAILPASTPTELGSMITPFQTIYLTVPPIIASDRNKKKSVEPLDIGLKLVSCLKPVSYQVAGARDTKTHWGLIAQDLEHALITCGLSPDTFGVLAKVTNSRTGTLDYGVSYTELLPIALMAIKELALQLEDLKRLIGVKSP